MRFPTSLNDAVQLRTWLADEYDEATADKFQGWKPRQLLYADRKTMIRRAGQNIGEMLLSDMNRIKAIQGTTYLSHIMILLDDFMLFRH